MSPRPFISRRAVLVGSAAFALVPAQALATPAEMRAAIIRLFGDRTPTEARVTLKVPVIAENGHSVSLSVEVDSPMTPDNHVRRIAIFAERNPLPDVVRFELGPRAGRARVDTRIRLADSQTLLAIAEMNDGTLYSGTAKTIVTLAACVI